MIKNESLANTVIYTHITEDTETGYQHMCHFTRFLIGRGASWMSGRGGGNLYMIHRKHTQSGGLILNIALLWREMTWDQLMRWSLLEWNQVCVLVCVYGTYPPVAVDLPGHHDPFSFLEAQLVLAVWLTVKLSHYHQRGELRRLGHRVCPRLWGGMEEERESGG